MPPPPPGSTPSGPPAPPRPGFAAEHPRYPRGCLGELECPEAATSAARSTTPPAVFGVRCRPPAADDDISTAMSGEQAAGGAFGMTPGTWGEGGAWGLLHVLAGYQISGGGLRAVCRCGHTGPQRAV